MNLHTENALPTAMKVLIIDDEPFMRQALSDLSELIGFETCTAADGLEAIAQFQLHKPHLVLLDLYMPKMNGLAVLARIRQLDPKCPVILIAGYVNPKLLADLGEKAKLDVCLLKPLNRSLTTNLMLKVVRNRSISQKFDADAKLE